GIGGGGRRCGYGTSGPQGGRGGDDYRDNFRVGLKDPQSFPPLQGSAPCCRRVVTLDGVKEATVAGVYFLKI
ncbi:hypothetical protein Tco_1160185, partial [Tanacetum coccineum]